MEKDAPTLPFAAEYHLTDEAFEREKTTTPDIKKRQCVFVYIDRKEAVRTGCAREVSGAGKDDRPIWVTDNYALCKLEPDLTRIGVVRNMAIPAFDHILSVKEATEIVEQKMARYDEVLAISRAACAGEGGEHPPEPVAGGCPLQGFGNPPKGAHDDRVGEGKLCLPEPVAGGFGNPPKGAHDDRVGEGKLCLPEPVAGGFGNPSEGAHDNDKRSNTVMATLTGTYTLTEEAHRELFLAGTPVTRDQTINVTVSAREALRTGYLHLHRDGKALQTGGISPRALFSKVVKMDSEGITREIPEFDHVLTEEEATKIITDEMDRYDAMSAETIKIAEKKVEKHREEIDDLIKTLDHYLPKIKKGEVCVIDPNLGIPQWFEMEGKRINIQYDLIKEKSGEDQAIKTGKFFVDERTKRSDEPVLGWIKEHGSPRLQRAVFEANLLDQVRELYHDERLAHDLPGWKFLHYATLTCDLMRAPFDHELDTFIEVAQTWPTKNARLCMIRKQHENAFTDEPILVMECPWNEEHAPVGLLLPASAPGSAPVENLTKDPNVDSHKEFYENLPSGTILVDCAGVPVRIMEMKGLHATGVRTLGNGKPNQEILAWSGRLSKKNYRLIT